MTGRGVIYTFYSFKGGVGRSMALANVAALMAKGGYRVLIIDWDLEAPGLEKYFSSPPSRLSAKRKDVQGILDMVDSYSNGVSIPWKDCLLYAHPFKEGPPVSILSGGRESPDYFNKLQNINWEYLFAERSFGNYLEELREEWVAEFDFVLIDSRTGVTDTGGICTIHLPDAIVLFFSANEQSIDGVKDVIDRVMKKYRTLPLDRSKLLAVPVPSRFETITENNLSIKWKGIIADVFREIYQDWIPDKTTPADILEKLFIPYIPYWSFGEGLPVVTEGTSNPTSLGFAYDFLARLLCSRLKWNEALAGEITVSNELSPDSVNIYMENIFNRFNETDRRRVRNIILRLISFDPRRAENHYPRKVDENEFTEEEKSIIEELVKARILYRDSDTTSKNPTIELIQKTILQSWDRLNAWVDVNREFLFWRQDLNIRAFAWEAGKKKKSELLGGSALKKAVFFLAERRDELNDLELNYISQSRRIELSKRAERLAIVFAFFIAILTFVLVFMGGNAPKSILNTLKTVFNDSGRVVK